MDRPFEVQRRHDLEWVPAVMRVGLGEQDLEEIERSWRGGRQILRNALRAANVPRDKWPQSLHWNWEHKSSDLQLLETHACGIRIEGRWEAVVMTKVASYTARLAEQQGKPLVYVDYLEVAPWNWRIHELAQQGEYRGLGSVLFREAVQLSKDEQFHGRVGLHALAQAESFYRDVCGMTDLGPDGAKQNLRYFEFLPSQADSYLKDGGES